MPRSLNVISKESDPWDEPEVMNSTDPASSLHYYTIDITPAVAKEFLGRRHPNQRALNPDRVKQHVLDMKNGKWENFGDPIKFSTEGYLIDWQHRLKAVIESGVTLPEILVVENVAESAFKVIDQGQKRTDRQMFQMSGVNISQMEINITKALLWTPQSANVFSRPVSKQVIFDLYERFRPSVQFAARQYDKPVYAVKSAAMRSQVARAHYIGHDVERLGAFLTALDTGKAVYTTDDMVIDLRKVFTAMTARRMDNTNSGRIDLLCKTQKVLHNYLNNQVKQVRATKVQLFPIDGLPN